MQVEQKDYFFVANGCVQCRNLPL